MKYSDDVKIWEDLKQTLNSINIFIPPTKKECTKRSKPEEIISSGEMPKDQKINCLHSIINGSKEEKLEALKILRDNYFTDAAVFILNAIDDDEPDVREFAARMAGELKIKEALEDLKMHLDDESDSVAEASLDSIMLINNEFIPEVVECVYKSGEYIDVLCKVLETPNEETFDVGISFFPKNSHIAFPSNYSLAIRGTLESGTIMFPKKESLKRNNYVCFRDMPPGKFHIQPPNVSRFPEQFKNEIIKKRELVAASSDEISPKIWTLKTDNPNIICAVEMEPDGNLIIRFSLINYPLKRITIEFTAVNKENKQIYVKRGREKAPFSGEIELEPMGNELFGEKFIGRLDLAEIEDQEIFIISYFK